MSQTLAHIADKVINRPLMILPEKLAVIATVLEGRINIDASDLKAEQLPASRIAPDASRHVGAYERLDPNNPHSALKPYRVTAGRTAIIPVIGSLVNRGSFLDAVSGIQSYENLKFEVSAAADDDTVKAILLDFDSPGGEAIGAFEAADIVREAAALKPVVAVVNGLCCSAAYAIASASTKIVTTSSGLSGSVGVVMMHADHSRRLDKEGLSVTLIHAGERKVDGNPYQPLTAEVTAELQSEINRVYDLFISTVVDGRPSMTVQNIRATEARCYMGADAVSVGLADEVGSFETALAQIEGRKFKTRQPRSRLSAAKSTKMEDDMSSVQAERDRVAAIAGLPEAEGKEAAALALIKTGASVDLAKQMLGCINVTTAAPVTPRMPSLAERMGGPQAGPDAISPEWSEPQAGPSLADRMRARHGIT